MKDIARLKQLMLNDNGFGFDPSSGFTYNLSVTGLDVVHWIKEGLSEGQLVERLCETCEVDRRTAERDIDAFLGSLAKYGLVRLQHGAKP